MIVEESVAIYWEESTPPTTEELGRLHAFARSRGAALVLTERAPAKSDDGGETSLDGERWVDAARAARAEGKESEAVSSLQRARELVVRHPAWPEAAWLRAEIERALGRENVARSLGGPRKRGVIELPSEDGEPTSPTTTFAVRREREEDRVYLDGRPYEALPAAEGDARVIASGPHALLVLRGGRTIRAEWLNVEGPLSVVLTANRNACTTAEASSGLPIDCPSWRVARRVANRIVLKECRYESCAGAESVLLPASNVAPRGATTEHAPTWLTVLVVGGGLALFSAGAVLASSSGGSEPTKIRFVSGGVHPAVFGR